MAEAALEPTLCEIAELENELEKEKELLRQDQEHLEELKKNAKAHEKVRAEKSRTVWMIFFLGDDEAMYGVGFMAPLSTSSAFSAC